jgi:hypothetical protein
MIVSKEPIYSLGGCLHRKGLITYSMKQEDNKILCETLCLEESEGAIIFESIPKFFSDYSLRGYSHREP